MSLKTIYIVAVGGQGSIVLTDWLFNAAHLEGYAAQSVGLPGLSQRGGATSFYMELWLSRDPGEQQVVVWGHYPVPGEVDIIIAQEFLELGRALERGYGSKGTAIVASTHRVLSLAEKMPASGGLVQDEDIYRLVQEFSGSFTGFNALELAKRDGLEEVAVNAILLGALSAADLLPISPDSYLEAIRQTGIAVEANLKAFALGRDFVASGQDLQPPPKPPEEGLWQRAQALSAGLPAKQRATYLSLVQERVAAFPPPLQRVLVEGVFQLMDYQGRGYALDYLRRVGGVAAQDRSDDCRLSQLFAASLASLMGYEDIVQVARLKTHPARFSGLRRELRVGSGQLYEVTDYFSPDAEELLGILPVWLCHLLSPPVLRRGRRAGVLRYRSPSTSFPGFILLKLLASLRFLRPASQRRRREEEWWREYQEAVAGFTRRDYELGCLVARCGQMVKGYGAIRRRNLETVRRLINNVLGPLAERETALGTGYQVALRVGEHARSLILRDETGIDRAEQLARWALGRLETGEAYQETLRLLSSPFPPPLG